MTITDGTVDSIAAGLPVTGLTSIRPSDAPNTRLRTAYLYSSTKALLVHSSPWNASRVRFLWMAYCYQQAVATALEPAFAVVYDCSPTGLWLLVERVSAADDYFEYLVGHQAQYEAILTDNAGLSTLLGGPGTDSRRVATMLADSRTAIIDAGLPPSGTHDIAAYDPAWMPTPF